jgi:hypothetical protein
MERRKKVTQANTNSSNNLTHPQGQTIIGVFDNVDDATAAINDLKVAGFTPDSISVLTRNRDANNTLVEETEGNEAAKGALSGALGGGTLGAVLGWLLAGGTALVPGIGPIVAAGVLGATITGALVGGSLGSLANALAGAGIPEEQAVEYEEHVKGGRTIVSAFAPTGLMSQSAHDVFERHSATNIRDYNDGTAAYVTKDDSYKGGPGPGTPGGLAAGEPDELRSQPSEGAVYQPDYPIQPLDAGLPRRDPETNLPLKEGDPATNFEPVDEKPLGNI